MCVAHRYVDQVGTFTPPDGLSGIGRLLQEVSYENARSYHDGGTGRENVLTVEVFQALDFLPRTGFLGAVMNAAHGADKARERLIEDIENTTVEVLVGDITPTLESGLPASWAIQPDAVIAGDSVTCLVEAKRLRPSRFQPEQVARCLHTVTDPNLDTLGFVLLVLADDPPIRVNGHGRVGLTTAVGIGLDRQGVAWKREELTEVVAQRFAWITWAEIASCVQTALEDQPSSDASVHAAHARLTSSISDSVRRHS